MCGIFFCKILEIPVEIVYTNKKGSSQHPRGAMKSTAFSMAPGFHTGIGNLYDIPVLIAVGMTRLAHLNWRDLSVWQVSIVFLFILN